MARPKAAQRAAAENATASLTELLSPARAAASRRNGAKSQGPRTPEGKARSAQNAFKHGLCADNYLVSAEEEQDCEALEAALVAELAPQGVLQAILVTRIVRASWRLERADRIEAELLEFRMDGDDDLGLAVTRDCNSARAFDTLQRYRGGAQAELFRALRTLKALQAEADAAPDRDVAARPNEPEARTDAEEPRADANPMPAPATPSAPAAKSAPAADAPAAGTAASSEMPIEPDGRANPGEMAGFEARGPAAHAA